MVAVEEREEEDETSINIYRRRGRLVNNKVYKEVLWMTSRRKRRSSLAPTSPQDNHYRISVRG